MTRVLVTYASKHGSTAEIAEAIADELKERNIDADCVDVEVASVEHFDAVVLGSAVYAGRWRHEAQHFLHRHRRELAGRALWIFSSGPVGENAADELEKTSRWLEPHGVLEAAEALGLRGHRVFMGKVPADPENFVEMSMARNTPDEFKDMRDWAAIRAWADEIAAALQPTSA